MSLFIGTLAFDDASLLNGVRLGVLMGSIASGILGFVLLRVFCKGSVENISEDTQSANA
jgi:NhaA family Na+:H+ antiporter